MARRIIIPGSTGFRDYPFFERVLDRLLPQFGGDIEIVSGHAKGVDQMGERYAASHGIPCTVFPAQWETYGKQAGPIRNSQMIAYAREGNPAVLAFWNGHSKGTLDTLVKAQNALIPTVVVLYGAGRVPKLVRYVYEDIGAWFR